MLKFVSSVWMGAITDRRCSHCGSENLYMQQFLQTYFCVIFHKMAEVVSTSSSPRVSLFSFLSASFVSPFVRTC